MARDVFVIAKREISLKLKSKVVSISAGLLILIAGLSPWISHLAQPQIERITVGVLSLSNLEVAQLRSIAERENQLSPAVLTFQRIDRKSGFQALSDGELASIISREASGIKIYLAERSSPEVKNLLERIFQQVNLESFFVESQISPDALSLHFEKNRVRFEQIDDGRRSIDYSVALFALVLLYMIISLSGGFLASTIIEEKSGRVMEVLLASISPRQLLLGKILGVLSFALFQFTAVVFTWLISSNLAGSNLIEGVTGFQLLWYFLWFLPAILAYSFIYGGLGALVSRSEDAGAIQGPMSLMLIGSIYVAIYTLTDSTSSLAQVATYIPPINFFVGQAQFFAQGAISGPVVIGYCLALAFTVVVILSALSLFEANALNNRKFKLRRFFSFA